MGTMIKLINSNKEIASYRLGKGKTLKLKAIEKLNYQLINEETGYAPEEILLKREGDNLKIYLDKDSKRKSADIVIEDYYKGDNEKDCLIIGKAGNGKIYAYVPESGDMAEAVTVLQDTKVALQVLGGEELSVPFWNQEFNPVWIGLGALALGGIALASSGSSGGG
ncbi:hypothetical protein QV08_09480 [Gallibacterium salpingitidis]|uniref:Uncharacterized protein n=1 Tax=Gallibacterium salpingitidis TaxID=505341 RepID=A0AB36E2X7_9PAST|nr:hypothetical protein [Gallibacterium salpingitidis]OBX06742.1 hypothetical protein QV08_09480 [Gallibacterium salpingitidis]OBX10490.1 hypothetical protein QV09_05235 [Gallibacterium salpingitidis]